jgi:mannitol-1-phosphate 5-dehydrogenase
MASKEILVIGAGKIGRGFIAHLFHRGGYKVWFLDASREVVDRLNREKQYRVDLAGETRDRTEYIPVAGAFALEDGEKVREIVASVPLLASSVGAAHVARVAGYVKEHLLAADRQAPLNWLICENANHPARTIQEVLLQGAPPAFADFVRTRLGLVETQVLRTGMAARAEVLAREPLALRMQDWWTLPLDADAFVGAVPAVDGLSPRPGFANELTRKLYTFNGTNGPIAYVGWANGYTVLHESALAYPDYFKAIQEESAFGLVHEFGLDEREQRAFMAMAMKKYTDPALRDQIERNAQDSKRKLGRHERLVGPALLCLRHGRMPRAYAKAIAAAYAYNGSADPGTQEVQAAVRRLGIREAVKVYSDLDESSPLYGLVVEAYEASSFVF